MSGDTPPNLSPQLLDAIPAIGTIIAGKYQVESTLGRGGMGAVLAARHIHLKERVALKILLLPPTSQGDFQARFLREAQVSAKLRNEHIARVMDVAVLDDGTPYMVMEFLEGLDLRQLLKQNGPLPVDVAAEYVVQACEGLAEAHAQGIVHRDLKPANLFLTRRSDGSDLIKLLDFGISKLMQPEVGGHDRTETGVLLGSPKYMSPEQLAESSDVDARADVWALGAILYELLTGIQPFNAGSFAAICARVMGGEMPPPIRRWRADVPEALDTAIVRCFARDRADRTASVALLAGDVMTALSSPVSLARAERIRAVLERTGIRPEFSTSGGLLPLGASQVSGAFPRDETAQSNRTGRHHPFNTSGAAGTLVSQTGPRSSPVRKLALPAALVAAALAGLAMRWIVGSSAATDAAASASAAANAGAPPAGGSTAAPGTATASTLGGSAANAAAPSNSALGNTAPSAEASASPAPAGQRATPETHPNRAPAWSPPRRNAPAPPPRTPSTTPPPATATPAPPQETAPKPAPRKVDPFEERQ